MLGHIEAGSAHEQRGVIKHHSKLVWNWVERDVERLIKVQLDGENRLCFVSDVPSERKLAWVRLQTGDYFNWKHWNLLLFAWVVCFRVDVQMSIESALEVALPLKVAEVNGSVVNHGEVRHDEDLRRKPDKHLSFRCNVLEERSGRNRSPFRVLFKCFLLLEISQSLLLRKCCFPVEWVFILFANLFFILLCIFLRNFAWSVSFDRCIICCLFCLCDRFSYCWFHDK